jgi:protease I
MPTAKTVLVMIENDYYEHEIWYYQFRFQESGVPLRLASRLWGQASLTFKGHEHQAPLECRDSFETVDDAALAEIAAVIVPSGYVADRLRYTDDLGKLPPATAFLARAFANKDVIKAIICHGLWLTAPATGLVKGRRLTCHPNLHGDAIAYGAEFVDQDVVEDGDLITARTGAHAHLLARAILARLGAI